jgi:hypothetical protein
MAHLLTLIGRWLFLLIGGCGVGTHFLGVAMPAPVAAQPPSPLRSPRLILNSKGELQLFAVGANGSAYQGTFSRPGKCWSSWTERQGHDLRDLAVAKNQDGRGELFVVGADGLAYHKWESSAGAAWTDWTSLEGQGLRQTATTANADGRLTLFALGADGAAYARAQTTPNGGWSDWWGLQGHDLKQIAAATNGDGRQELFGLGADGAVYHKWQSSLNGPWQDWQSLEGHDLRQIAAIASSDGRLELFALGADGVAYHRSQVVPNGGWGPWDSIGGTNLRQLTAALASDGTLVVAGLDSGSLIRMASRSPSGAWEAWKGYSDCETPGTPAELLASYWAPVLSHDTDAHNTRADYVTRFDFDGNWSGKDNWDNLDKFALPANVYYWVIETSAHYYIGYAFFHPRDWSSSGGPAAEHNNDLEAIVLDIAKGTPGSFGNFLAMVTVAHNDFYSFIDTDTPAGSPWYSLVEKSRLVRGNNEDIDGDVDFVVDGFGLHPVVYVEAEGHGVYGVHGAGYGVSDWAPIFNDEGIVDWRSANFAGIVPPPRSGSPGQAYDVGSWDDGVIYHYEGIADVPAGPGQTSNDSLPHQWQVIGYQLLDIKPLWERRNDYACVSEAGRTFESDGNFVGSGAQAPWGLRDQNDNVPRGWIFTTPMFLFTQYFSEPGSPTWPSDESSTKRSYSSGLICPN